MSREPRGLAGYLSAAFAGPVSEVFAGSSPETRALRPAGSRRRRLWELPQRFHCPVVGVCFSCAELRGLLCKVMLLPPATSDYVLHTTAVGACGQRCAVSELLQRVLEQRFRRVVQSLKAIKSPERLRDVWKRACSEGDEVPAMLWACWTHPALDATLEQEIYGDIHMLQHQLGSCTRAEIGELRMLRDDNRALQDELAAASAALVQLRVEKATALDAAAQQIGELRAALAAANTHGERLARELAGLRQEQPAQRALGGLRRRVASLEIRLEGARQREAALQSEAARLRDLLRQAEETRAMQAAGSEEAALALPERDLSGKRVLCVGGRSGALHSYREVVERSGGEFMHHDGGLEESLQRIDSVVAAADVVICQAGCISHNAYWRVKEHCKRTGKRCVFVKSAGVASFNRAVDLAGRADEVAVSPDSPCPKPR